MLVDNGSHLLGNDQIIVVDNIKQFVRHAFYNNIVRIKDAKVNLCVLSVSFFYW
jgi:hypothetical protein